MTVLGRAARERCGGPVVAISGSNGKTTTRALVEAVLRSRHGRVLATRGNLNNHLGVPLSLLNGPDHPEAIVLELGMSAPGENERLAAVVRPDVAVITSVALEHLEFMGSLEAIAAAEAEPLRHVRAGGVAVVPDDEPLLPPHFPPGLSILRFGEGPDAAVRILGVELDERTHATLQLHTPRRQRGDPPEPAGVRGPQRPQRGGRPGGRAAPGLSGRADDRGARGGPAGRRSRPGAPLRRPPPAHRRQLQRQPRLGHGGAAQPGRAAPVTAGSAGRGDRRHARAGRAQPELHAEVGRLAAALKLDALFTFGTLSQAAADAAKAGGIASWHAGLCVSDLVAAVRAAFAERPGALLVKGSRGMRLERVVEALLQAPPKAV
nr:Mur ligase family protein [Nannocystis pusilla]